MNIWIRSIISIVNIFCEPLDQNNDTQEFSFIIQAHTHTQLTQYAHTKTSEHDLWIMCNIEEEPNACIQERITLSV